MSYKQTKYERDDPRNTDPLVDKTLGSSYWVVREIYKNLPFLRYLTDKIANLDINNVQFQSNTVAQRIEWKYENQDTWNVLVSYEDLLGDSLAQALMPINAELESQADIMDAFAQSLNNITSTLNAQSNTINATIERVEALEEGNETFAGWIPILSLVPDGQRLVMQITDWTGGVGTKPPVDVYIGSEGYVTDIAEAENLKGSQGATGSQGVQGVKGDKGDKGDDGEAGANGVGVPVGGTTGQVLAKASNADLDTQWIDPPEGEGGGTPGADGKSAYEVAVENGFVGTEVEWLASLKGEQGEQGIQGEQGEKGDTGDAGATELAGLTDVDLTTPPTNGQVLVYDVATETWIPADQTGGGGGEGSADDLTAFKGATSSGINNAGSTSSFATKGTAFRVERDCTITAMSGHIGGSGSSATSQYRFDIYELSSITLDANDNRYATSVTIGSLVGSTTSTAMGTTEVKYLQLPMVENVVLEAGVEYIAVAVLINGVGTTPNRITTSSLVDGWILNAPVTTFRGAFQFNSIGLSAAQTPDNAGNGTYTVALIGTESLGLSGQGASAYEIAVDNGFVGTEVEWLESLQGEQGIQGEQGEKGDDGDTVEVDRIILQIDGGDAETVYTDFAIVLDFGAEGASLDI